MNIFSSTTGAMSSSMFCLCSFSLLFFQLFFIFDFSSFFLLLPVLSNVHWIDSVPTLRVSPALSTFLFKKKLVFVDFGIFIMASPERWCALDHFLSSATHKKRFNKKTKFIGLLFQSYSVPSILLEKKGKHGVDLKTHKGGGCRAALFSFLHWYVRILLVYI